MTTYRIPIVPRQHQMRILMSRPVLLRFLYVDAPMGGWIMDIADGVTNLPILSGVLLVTGHDILGQYEYLGLGGQLFLVSDGDPDAPPTYEGFGVNSFLYFVVP